MILLNRGLFLRYVQIKNVTILHNPYDPHMRENQLNIATLMHEKITTSARVRAISCEVMIDEEFLYFSTTEPIARPAPAPAKAPSASTMRISKAFILVNFSSPGF